MVNRSIALIVRKYLSNLQKQDISITYGVVFGSHARGEANQWSDIDLLVVSPRFDQKLVREDLNLLCRIAARTDSRIEPIPVGQGQFLTDDSSAIIEIARREGEIISLA